MKSVDKKNCSLLSYVTPAYNEQENLPALYERILSVTQESDIDWEWVIVDDHSGDHTYQIIQELAAKDKRVRGIRLARNSGSHTALSCGLHRALGDCAIIIAADLQDPPETTPTLLEKWERGAQVVWAIRQGREGEKASKIGFANLYYWIMRKFVGIADMPATGADFFLLDRRVLDAFRQFRETNTSIMALITWMGFKQDSIYYAKQARLHGTSGWSLRKKLKLVVDSVTSFTYHPIRLMSYLGFLVASGGFLFALYIIIDYITGNPAQGWPSLMVAILILGGIQMMMMGVLGEYLWRSLDEARRRPRFIIEDETDAEILAERPQRQ